MEMNQEGTPAKDAPHAMRLVRVMGHWLDGAEDIDPPMVYGNAYTSNGKVPVHRMVLAGNGPVILVDVDEDGNVVLVSSEGGKGVRQVELDAQQQETVRNYVERKGRERHAKAA